MSPLQDPNIWERRLSLNRHLGAFKGDISSARGHDDSCLKKTLLNALPELSLRMHDGKRLIDRRLVIAPAAGAAPRIVRVKHDSCPTMRAMT